MIDELENFSAEQQQLIQTLIREKPVACTFRVGTRPYGVRTLKTLRGVEENHDGAEFQAVILDEFLRNYKYYPKYVTDILINRLRNSGISLPREFSLESLFEEQTNSDILKQVASKKDRQSRSYMATLETKLTKIPLQKEVIAEIMFNMAYPDDILIERTNVFLMYSAIKDNKERSIEAYVNASKEIAKSARSYVVDGSRDNLHATKLEKYKQDLVDTLAREGRVEIPYNGLSKLIELSCGTPRTILCLLKAAFNNQYYNTGKVPFEEGRKLTVKSQRIGIESTYDWFFEENRIPSMAQARATDAIMRLGDYLRKARFADLPPQCSINIFTLNAGQLSPNARMVFEALLSYSYIVQTDERRQINSDNKTHVYQLNKILYPKYELASSKRGAINFNPEDAECIFNLEMKADYDAFVDRKMKGYNFPFGGKQEQAQLIFDLFK